MPMNWMHQESVMIVTTMGVKMSNVKPMNAKALTPTMVLEKCLEVENVKHAYIVLIHEDGTHDLRASGDLSMMASACLYMSHYATENARGNIE